MKGQGDRLKSMTATADLTFRAAMPPDAGAVTALIEHAYRGPAGAKTWTSESHLLTGPRTAEAEITALIRDPDSRFVLAERDGQLRACALVQKDGQEAYFGMFAVDPAQQAGGIGRALLAECERVVRDLWDSVAMNMVVISVRDELIAWYQRRGYEPTGEREPFPFGPLAGELRRDFDLVVLKKRLQP